MFITKCHYSTLYLKLNLLLTVTVKYLSFYKIKNIIRFPILNMLLGQQFKKAKKINNNNVYKVSILTIKSAKIGECEKILGL